MQSLFGPFDVRVDPWEVDYGSQTPVESIGEEADETVVLDIEQPAEAWSAVIPESVTAPAQICFVDGVRRLEARLLVRRDWQILHGGFGSHAVGVVRVRNGRAMFGEAVTGREVILGSGEKFPGDVKIRPGLVYAAISAMGAEPDAPLRAIQANMRRAEGRLAGQLAAEPDTLVVSDGPLSFEAGARGTSVGMIKRITELYLPANYVPFLAALPSGSRTPLFGIRAQHGGFSRLAWFVRLAPVLRGESELHGLVRLECREAVGTELAATLANLTAAVLPRFAPSRGRDPRSPQNLLPIGALEQRLRHSLGDARRCRRWIETCIIREVTHV